MHFRFPLSYFYFISCKLKVTVLSIVFSLSFVIVNAQISDLARVDYTFFPAGDSIVQFNKFNALVNVPIKLKNEAYLLLGLDYSDINLRFGNNIPGIDKSKIEQFRLLDFNISYIQQLDDEWTFGARFTPGFSSNLTENSLLFDDMVFSGLVVFIKDVKETEGIDQPYRLILGISYRGNGGIRYPLPFISYYRKFLPKWSFNVGIPKMDLEYHYSEKSRFKIIAELDGFNSNIQEGLIVNEDMEADRINMSLIFTGLRYEFHVGKHWELFAAPGYVISNRVKLKNDAQNTVLILNNESTFYFRTGLRLKI